jgi:UDPglucose 6-dehydrogenase
VRAAIGAKTNVEFDVVSNPEFLREGVAVEDFMKPERVVVGTRSERARQLMDKLYRPFVLSGNPVIYMDERSSELTKYAANSFLATKISFMNEVANLCERVGADVDAVRKGIGTDSRIGKRFLFAGVGYGGSCFPKDVQALDFTADEYGYNFQILKAVMNWWKNCSPTLAPTAWQASASAFGGWPSSPTPTTSARPRPWSSSKNCWHGGPRSVCSTPWQWMP